MTWTSLNGAFEYRALLTSLQLTHLYSNLDGFTAGDEGSPKLQNAALTDLIVGSQHLSYDVSSRLVFLGNSHSHYPGVSSDNSMLVGSSNAYDSDHFRESGFTGQSFVWSIVAVGGEISATSYEIYTPGPYAIVATNTAANAALVFGVFSGDYGSLQWIGGPNAGPMFFATQSCFVVQNAGAKHRLFSIGG
jgi:hypothetical protein